MIAARSDDDGVDDRAAIAVGAADDVGYALPRASRRRRRLVVPTASVGLGALLGGGALALLRLL